MGGEEYAEKTAGKSSPSTSVHSTVHYQTFCCVPTKQWYYETCAALRRLFFDILQWERGREEKAEGRRMKEEAKGRIFFASLRLRSAIP